jgi:hypothetical protein
MPRQHFVYHKISTDTVTDHACVLTPVKVQYSPEPGCVVGFRTTASTGWGALGGSTDHTPTVCHLVSEVNRVQVEVQEMPNEKSRSQNSISDCQCTSTRQSTPDDALLHLMGWGGRC